MSVTAGLIAHWPLETDHHNQTSHELSAIAHGIEHTQVGGKAAAKFNGVDGQITVTDHPALRTAGGDFAISLHVHSDKLDDVVGDLISKFDPDTRRGFNLVVSTQTGVTQTTQSNYRHIQFGIDNAQHDAQWTDCGRPGNAMKISALATVNGSLYAGTLEHAAEHYGHLWRYDGDGNWHDMGATPPKCNCVGSITYHNGAMYCATGRYNPNGSMLGDPKNPNPGGYVYRIEADGSWTDCGHVGAEGASPDDVHSAYTASNQADETTCMTSYRGELFAVSHHRRGVWKYEGGKEWKLIGPDMRIMSFTVQHGCLFALINGGGVYRYEGGSDWTYCGAPPRSTQTYCAVTYQNKMLVGTWPECEIIRYDGGESWTKIGRVGYEREVMATALYNGKCYFGTLPMANVFRMDSDGFKYMGNLDNDPSVCLRRVWSMAVHDGQMFAGTLPRGRVMRMSAGRVATHDHALEPGWRHIVAARAGDKLKLYLDGKKVGESASMNAKDFDLNNDQPLVIGGGIGHVLTGALRDVRIYNRALDDNEVKALGQ